MGAVWLVGRVVYAVGYKNDEVKGEGKGRYKGVFYVVGQLGVWGLAVASVFEMVKGSL